MFSTLRLHALRGLNGDATECKSNFRITYINVHVNVIASLTGPKCSVCCFWGFYYFIFSSFDMEVYFPHFAKKKERKKRKEIHVTTSL